MASRYAGYYKTGFSSKTYGKGKRSKEQQARLAKAREGLRAANVRRVTGGPMIAARQRLGELKGMDTDISLSPIIATTNTNGSSFVLNLVQQGAGSWNRVGRKIYPKSLRVKGVVTFTNTPTFATGNQNGNWIRMVVVHDQQPSSGSIPTFDTIFGITAQDGAESCPDITCPPRYDNMDRFRVVKDCTFRQPDASVVSFGSAPSNVFITPVDEYLEVSNLPETVFSGQSAPMTIADISTGAIYVYFRAGVNAASTTTSFDGIARLRYTD